MVVSKFFFALFLINGFVFSLDSYNKGLLFSLEFDGNTNSSGSLNINPSETGTFSYPIGLSNQSIFFDGSEAKQFLSLGNNNQLDFSDSDDFTVQIWVKSENDSLDTAVFISNSDLTPQYQAYNQGRYPFQMLNEGWSIFGRNGTWGFNIGDGNRNYHYQPHEGTQSMLDGEWHQIIFSHNSQENSIRVYFDGQKKALINISDLSRNFSSSHPINIGVDGRGSQSDFNSFKGYFDNLKIWDQTLTDAEVEELYTEYYSSKNLFLKPVQTGIKVLSWNIWHGGHHYVDGSGGGQVVSGDIWDNSNLVNNWDGVVRIADLIEQTEADIVLLQESYGSGPRIASLLGFEIFVAAGLFSNQVWGPNITVLSRYPIEVGYMRAGSQHNSAGSLIKLSQQQKVAAFSNWYPGGSTSELTSLLNHWDPYIKTTDLIPVFYGGDYNGVTYLDGGNGSGHHRIMTDQGFTDSYREAHPDPSTHPGVSIGSTRRIDFLYYKGSGMSLSMAEPLADNFSGAGSVTGFPSDHNGFIAGFDINFITTDLIPKNRSNNILPKNDEIKILSKSNFLEIDLGYIQNQISSLIIMNIQGVLIRHINWKKTPSTFELSSKDLKENGIYILRVNHKKNIRNKLFINQ